MRRYQYDFSVVMPVYNVEAYIREAVESLVNQTLGFSRIQLILVDDGSPDGCGAICDAWQKEYPGNVTVVHKENGGLSSARNAGLPYVKGKYLNFMDPDDKIDADAFRMVRDFFERHENETDVVGIPVCYFDGKQGEHVQNRKFSLGQEVLDLYRTWDVTNLQAASSFVRTESAEGILFEGRIPIAEDARYLLEIMMKKMTLGLVKDTRYWYRIRSSGPLSLMQVSRKNAASYIPYLKYFSNWLLDRAQEIFGEIPKFVQYEVMYDLQGRFVQDRIPEGVLSEEESETYKQMLFRTAGRIDDDVILRQRQLGRNRIVFILSKKYGCDPEVRQISAKTPEEKDIKLYFGRTPVVSVANMKTVLEFLRFDEEDKICTVEGYHLLYGVQEADAEAFLMVNGKEIPCEKISRPEKGIDFQGEKLNRYIGFRGEFEPDPPMQISTGIRIGKARTWRKKVSVGQFFPVSRNYTHSYWLAGPFLFTLRGESLFLEKKPGLAGRITLEKQFREEILQKDSAHGDEVVSARRYCHFMRIFKRKKIWIISDRINKADDNGEALFCYLQKHRPAGTKIYFALSKESADYARLSENGNCVDAMSIRHKRLHLLCDVNISSAADEVTVNPFRGYHDALRDLLAHQKFVFLQHGIIVNDLSGWLNRFNKDISGFVTASAREQASIVNGAYHYPAERVWLTGSPRHDRLYHDEKNAVTVMPTWRKYLMKSFDPVKGQWTLCDGFFESRYYQFFDSLLNHERLLSFLEDRGYTLQFFPHPTMQPFLEKYRHDPRVVFLPGTASYREIFARSKMVVTDYSSAAHDFSYLRKPVIYCQFDREEFLSGGHVYTKGYFDYDEDGFGEVVFDLESAVDSIIRCVSDDCRLKEEYRERIDSFFAFSDRDCCRRVSEKIQELTKAPEAAGDPKEFALKKVIRTLKEKQFLFEELVKRDFKQKYKRTVFGMAWSILNPLLTLLVMRLVFTRFFGRHMQYYTTYLFAGNLIYSYFRESTNGGMQALMSNAAIFTKINVPKYMFLLSKNVSSVINFGLTLVVFFLFAAIDGVPFRPSMLGIIYPIITVTMFNLGVGMILSALFVFFRDTKYLYDVFTLLLMYLSAIFYNVDAFPARVQRLFLLNPVYCGIKYFRVVVIDGNLPSVQYHLLLLFYGVLALFIGGFIYKKFNQKFLYYV